MKREIDRSLFGASPDWQTDLRPSSSSPVRKVHRDEHLEDLFPGAQSEMNIRTEVEGRQVEKLRSKVDRMEVTIEKMATRLEELGKVSHLKSERLAQAIARSDEHMTKMAQDLSAKVAQLTGKVNERRLVETKVQEMVDRHNQIVHTFEQRMSQLQKLLSEKELHLAGYHSALEEARQTISRLKRIN